MPTLLLFLMVVNGALAVPNKPPDLERQPQLGSVTNNCYENDFFKLKYEFPAGWRVRWVGSKADEPNTETGREVYELLMVQHPESPHPVGQVHITAVDISNRPLDAGERVLPDELPTERNPDLKRKRGPKKVRIAGRDYIRTDFEMKWLGVTVLYETKLSTEIGDHALVFTLNAGTKDILKELLKTMETVSFEDPGSCK